MSKLTLLTLAAAGAFALTARADDKDTGEKKPEGTRPQLTEEQKKIRKEITAKYDTNKDGHLDAEERKSISAEDKDKLAKISLGPRKKKTEGPKEETK